MNFKKLKIFILFIFNPLMVLAHGEYVLYALLIDFLLFLFITIIIIGLKIKWIGKLILFLMYAASLFLLFYIIDQVNYLENLTVINIGSALFPPTIVYLTYKAIKIRFQKTNS